MKTEDAKTALVRKPARRSAVCIVSGGMDSVCYSAILAQRFDIYMITFAYGQRAKREIGRARYFSKVLKARAHKVVDIGFMKALYGKSNSLTDTSQRLSGSFNPSLVVPIRNAVFITIASAWAMSIGARVVAYGAHAGDMQSYPDCRPAFANALCGALNLAEADAISSGSRLEIEIMSPAIENIDKASLIRAGHKILGDRIFRTWSCYTDGVTSGRTYLHCGCCESCINRNVALRTAKVEDRTHYAKISAGTIGGKAKRNIYEH